VARSSNSPGSTSRQVPSLLGCLFLLEVHEDLGQIPRILPLVELPDQISSNFSIGEENAQQIEAGTLRQPS
jgi:hypothetical protein